MGTKFTSKINGNDIYAKRAEATRSGVNLETFTKDGTTTLGILPAGISIPESAEDTKNILATQQYVLNALGDLADALVYMGTVDKDHPLPDGSTETTQYKKGWTYKVAEEGAYAGHDCEIGDMLIANKNYASGDDPTKAWDAIQTNIDGAVTGPASVTADGNLAVYNGTTGKVIKDSGVSLTDVNDAIAAASTAIQSVKLAGASDPLSPDANKQIVIPNAIAPSSDTNGSAGLMSAADKAKLDGITQAQAGSNTPGMVTFDVENL